VDSRVRILFATDVHGSDPVWKKFIKGASFYKADVLILGGDITGKNVVPVVANSNDGSYSAEFQGIRHSLHSREELTKFEEIVNRTGSYMYLTTAKELEELDKNKKRSNEIFTELIVAKLRCWLRYAEVNATVPIYVNAGNDDEPVIDKVLAESTKIIQPEDKVVEIATNYEMISAGFSNLTPWKCPRDLTEEEIEERLERKISKLSNPNRAIFNIHCPPVNSGLDTCPKLDSSVYPPKPLFDGGGIVLYGAGSTAVRAAIEKYQPMLGLHGHIHESRNIAKIGKTVCLNPGSEYGEGILRGVLVNIDQKGYRSYQFVSG
jgi:Icc-related predicted phosphoesterase